MKRLVTAASLMVSRRLRRPGSQQAADRFGRPACRRRRDGRRHAADRPQVTREILQSDPRNIGALLRQGDALDGDGPDPDAAGECYRRALRSTRSRWTRSAAWAGFNWRWVRPGEAEAVFRKAIDRTPNDAAALNNLGIALDLQDRHDEAQAAYQAALARRPSMTAAQVNLGLSLALAGATDRAVAILRPLASDPAADGRIRQDLAVALTLAGDRGQAAKVLAGEAAAGQGLGRTRRLCRAEGLRQMKSSKHVGRGGDRVRTRRSGVHVVAAARDGDRLAVDDRFRAGGWRQGSQPLRQHGHNGGRGITPPPPDRNSSIVGLVLQSSGGLLLASRLQFTAASYATFAALAVGGAGTPGPGTATQVVQGTFTYTEPYLTPIATAITGNQRMIHSVQVTVLNQPFPAN